MQNIIDMRKELNNASGISLIELSIVLIISGLILVPLLFAAQIYMEQYRQEKLLRLEKTVHNVMKAYAQKYNRYPCPASRSSFGDGAENCSIPLVEGARSIWTGADLNKNKVMVGVFPEYTIESGARVYLKSFIPSDDPIIRDFLDPWGGRLTYFVTKGLSDASSFNSGNGTVAVVDENGNPTDGIDRNALYALISHGSDQAGAVNVNGVIAIPCPGASHELEVSNCSTGNMATTPLISGLIRKSGGMRVVTDGSNVRSIHDYYNDHVFSKRFYEKDLWIPLPEGNNARVNLYSQSGKRIGIGISNPQESLDLIGFNDSGTGSIRIDRALVMGYNKYATSSVNKDKTGLICTTKDPDNDGIIDENGNGKWDAGEVTCVNPMTFFKLKCSGTNQYIRKISIDSNYNLVAECQSFRVVPPTTGNPPPSCPSNKVIRGIYSNGDIMCTSGNQSDNGSNETWVP
jgi:type II secretory pathway pseudopilin PulG